jgi:O-antigen biosynthesis protein
MELLQQYIEHITKYIQKAQLILDRDGFPGLLIKIKEKIWHIITHKIFFFLRRDYIKRFLERPRPISFESYTNPQISTPQVSIIVYIDDSALYTYRCLKSIQKNLEASSNFAKDLAIEIILINDCAGTEVTKFLKQVSGTLIINNEQKLGALKSYNLAAATAKGDFLCFLDRDCYISANYFDSLLPTINPIIKDNVGINAGIINGIGIVGSKLIHENRKLKSAGGIVWQDGSYCEYGNDDSSDEPEYNYLRLVDFCLIPGLLIKSELFQKLGCLSRDYTSDIYAAADLCFAARQLNQGNYQVIYQPKAELTHRSSSHKLASKPDLVEQQRFSDRWNQSLSKHLVNLGTNLELAARRLRDRPVILIVDTLVPAYDKDSGSYRLFNIIKILKNLDYQIIFLPDYGHEQEPYTSELENLGIEVLCHTYKQSNSLELLKRRLPIIDLAWVCRPELCEKYIDTLRLNSQIKIIYDTIDLHFVRLKRQWEFALQHDSKKESKLTLKHQSKANEIDKAGAKAWQEMQVLEVKHSQIADATIVVTDVEKNILDGFHANHVHVVPNIHQIYERPISGFSDRRNLLFIGGYYHAPNIDAVTWLCQEIMPLVWAVDSTIKVTLLGSNPSPVVKALANDRVFVPGYIKDVEPYFLNHRLFVAPLRYGAGMKGKIGHSLSYGLPTVTTAIGAEGMGLVSGLNALIEDRAEIFAESILSLYNDEALWSQISQNSIKAVEKYSPLSVQSKLAEIIDALIPARV